MIPKNPTTETRTMESHILPSDIDLKYDLKIAGIYTVRVILPSVEETHLQHKGDAQNESPGVPTIPSI